MERELLLLVNNKHCNRVNLEDEIESMKKMLPSIESFNSFFSNNDVFNSSSKKPLRILQADTLLPTQNSQSSSLILNMRPS